MATLFVRHKVADYAVWKKAYDDFDAERNGMGVTSAGAYQLDGYPNDITVYHAFATMDAAKAFGGSARLHEAMEGAGVQGRPEVWFANRV